MRRQVLSVLLGLIGFTVGSPSTSAAQTMEAGAYAGVITDASNTENEIIGAWLYHFGRILPDANGRTTPFGIPGHQAASAGLVIVPGIVAEGGLIFSGSSLTFMAGPRLSIVPPRHNLAAYGEFLIGGLHFSGDGFSGTDLLMMPAGGVVIAIPHSRLKISGEIGFPIESVEGLHLHATRVVGGVVFPIGHSH